MDPSDGGWPEPGSDDELFVFAMMDEEQRRHGPSGHGGSGGPGGCLLLLAVLVTLAAYIRL